MDSKFNGFGFEGSLTRHGDDHPHQAHLVRHNHENESHGIKRRADDQLDHDQRLAKRLGLLNLSRTGQAYIPVEGQGAVERHPVQHQQDYSEQMQLDDTKDKVYVFDLDEDLSDPESDDKKLVFLPDIDKHLSGIPKAVLARDSDADKNKQIILYNPQTSLMNWPPQNDVRKAIAESRVRARERQAQERRDSATLVADAFRGPNEYKPETVYTGSPSSPSPLDGDPMDLG
ncbi:MAG: hypothetical protein M1825_002894 [Sarcosagium campestre]|nr:MAG: hypothetical protein M1825_002894 [Sarcosagium campestre]